ncbi:hypothetical protein AHF37_00938, partial [Paragonimus kellicotti]
WGDFTAAELSSFLRILDKEEAEYKNAIFYQYGLLKDQVEKRLLELEHDMRMNSRIIGPNYSRVSVPSHPHAFIPVVPVPPAHHFTPVHEGQQCDCSLGKTTNQSPSASSKGPAIQPNEDAATPTDNEPTPIGLGDLNSESHSSLLPPPSPRASANVKVLATLNGIADGSGLAESIDSGISQPIRSSSPAAQYSSISGNSSFSSGFETVRPTHLPNATAHPASELPASISLVWESTRSVKDGDCGGGDKSCGMTPCSNASSAPTLSYHNSQREHSPPSFHDDAWLPDSPALVPSTHSSDPSEKQTSHPTSPDANSLLLPPPAPWNVIEYADGTPSESDHHIRYSVCCRLAEPETADLDREPPPPSSFSDGLNEHFAKPRSSVTEDGGGMVGTLDSDVFTYTTPLTPEFSKPVDGDSGSDMVSSIADEGTYAFSTLDSEYMAWMRLSVMDVVTNENDLCPLTTETLDSTPRSQVHRWVDLFNSNPLGLRLNFVDDSCRLAGTLRIHINLIKPVKMSLRQTMDMLPESAFKQTGNEHASPGESPTDHENGAQHALPPPARLVSFFLPRGTSKVVYILSSTTSLNAVQSLLDRFHIQESSRKFALYEHTLEQGKIVARKLTPTECPLLVLLNWARISSTREEFLRLLHQKRIVLQENDSCDINVSHFSTRLLFISCDTDICAALRIFDDMLTCCQIRYPWNSPREKMCSGPIFAECPVEVQLT